jgi:ubiquinone/menaquinone biosynthesis C-methylase UbiE
VAFISGDVAALPVEDASQDLVISRDSVFFWEDLPLAFTEILRVLRPGGHAYVGGGFGSAELAERIVAEMHRHIPGWQAPCRRDEGLVLCHRSRFLLNG